MGFLRKIVLKFLKATAFDTTIKHHFTQSKFLLNTYNHKGYWYYGAKREENTIKQFQAWIKPNDYVLEIGGHIGYFTTFYANIVGKNGKVDVFEPSEKNAKYLNKNIDFLPNELKQIVTLVKKGAGDIDGVLDFYIDPITGQNNSFVKNFEGFFSNRESSAESNAELIKESVPVARLDTYFQNATKFPDFVKIDVEGFEWNVIEGFKATIAKSHPALMIEIQADSDKIISFFKESGYTIYNDEMQEIENHAEYLTKKSPNIFFRYNK
jgi:FkbM family methyltransferase